MSGTQPFGKNAKYGISTKLDSPEFRWNIFLRSVSAAALLLLLSTYRLWIPGNEFPKVPLLAFSRGLFSGGTGTTCLLWCSFSSLVIAALGILIAPHGQHQGKKRFLGYLWAFGFCLAVLINQHALQPWAYHFLAVFLLAATVSSHVAQFWMRWLVVGIYAWSAIGKLDTQFFQTVGSQMVRQTLSFLGVGEDWRDGNPDPWLASLLPAWELAVAVLLIFPRTWRFGLAASIAMHLGLLLILGPLGLGHKPGVLIWNVLFLLQAFLLFWPRHDSRIRTRDNCQLAFESLKKRRLGPSLVLFMLIAPLGERLQWTDHWPSWALYAPHSSRVTMWITLPESDDLPDALHELMQEDTKKDVSMSGLGPLDKFTNQPPAGNSPTGPFDTTSPFDRHVPLDKWSLESLGVPIYPQARFQLGVAIALCEALGIDREVRVEIRGMASRLTGERETQWLRGLPALRVAASRYRLNALPADFEVADH